MTPDISAVVAIIALVLSIIAVTMSVIALVVPLMTGRGNGERSSDSQRNAGSSTDNPRRVVRTPTASEYVPPTRKQTSPKVDPKKLAPSLGKPPRPEGGFGSRADDS